MLSCVFLLFDLICIQDLTLIFLVFMRALEGGELRQRVFDAQHCFTLAAFTHGILQPSNSELTDV